MSLRYAILIAIAAIAVFALPTALASPLSNDDFYELQENQAARIPVLRNDDPGAGAPYLDVQGSLVASDASGPVIITINGMDFYAFKNIDDLAGAATAQGGWTSLAGVDPARIGYTGDDHELVGVTGTDDVAYEVYGETDGSRVPFNFTLDGGVMATGTMDVATVVVDRNESSATFGLATGYGQITLAGPAGGAFFEEAVAASCGRGVLYYELERFVPTRFSDPDVIETAGYVQPVGFEVVSVTQALHGTVTIDASGTLALYSPDFGFDGTDHFTYTARHCATGTTTTATVTVKVVGKNDWPVPDFAAPAELLTLDEGAFTDASTDVDGTIVAWSWNFGDGSGASGPSVTHAFADDGVYRVCLIVTDDDGASAAACRHVTVTNRAPLAAFDAPAESPTLDEVAFVDGSDDLDGSIVAWSWSFGDGATSSDANPTHAYAQDGTYDVCLTVTDDDGASATTCAPITILNRAPVAAATHAPAPARLREPVAFADLSADLDGSVVAWTWSFGDGATSHAQHPTHAYDAPGDYAATLTVADDDGATDTLAFTVRVLPVLKQAEATGVRGTALGQTLVLGSTGRVATDGSQAGFTELGAADAGVASAAAFVGYTEAALDSAVATASVSQIALRVPGAPPIALEGAEAVAYAACDASWGRAQVGVLHVGGERIDAVDAAPNTEITLPLLGVRLVLNEQRVDADGNLVVTALRVVTPLADVEVASALAGVAQCAPTPPAGDAWSPLALVGRRG